MTRVRRAPAHGKLALTPTPAKDLLCAELVAALGDEGKHGTGKGAPSAPTTSEPPAAPDDKGDRKVESEKVLVEAQKLQASGDGSFEAKLLGGLFTAALGGGALAYGAATTEGEVFLAGLAEQLGFSSAAAGAEAVASAATGARTAIGSRISRTLQNSVGSRLARLVHRGVNPVVRNMVRAAVRQGTQRASEQIPLLARSLG